MTSQTGYKETMHILPDISRCEDNQTMIFCQLTEYNMRNVFVEKSSAKWVRETNPRPFFKKSKLSIYLGQHCEVSYNLFSLYAKVDDY